VLVQSRRLVVPFALALAWAGWPALASAAHGGTAAAEPAPQGALSQAIVGGILLATYVLISLERWHRTLVALVGGSVLLAVTYLGGRFVPALRIIDFGAAMAAIDWNVIFLLLAMMIIVGVLKETGVFQWFAFKTFQVAGGSPFRMAALMMVLTAVVSANLDNVTTMLLIAPVSIAICRVIGMSPLALLIPETLASNIGGMATLIGDPPNIMIGSYAGLTYVDFVVELAPISAVILAVHLVQMRGVYRKDYAKVITKEQLSETLRRLEGDCRIANAALLWQSGLVLAAVTLLFLVHGAFDMPVAVPALLGAAAALLCRDRIETKRRRAENLEPQPVEQAHGILHALEKEVEWPTLIFFAFLFIIVGAAERVGLIHLVAVQVQNLSAGNLMVAALLTLWVSAIASAFIDNIPFTATMLPLLSTLHEGYGPEGDVLWWALALGACLGGNGTIIGASANVVTAGIAEKAGAPISFRGFMKVAFPAMLVEVAIATLWLLWR
jgi:Na+/H+ antiporter NhaD/arsenite permease-like protein